MNIVEIFLKTKQDLMFPAIRAPADRSRPHLLGFASCRSPHFICAYLPRICQVSPVHRAFLMRSVRSGPLKYSSEVYRVVLYPILGSGKSSAAYH